MNHIVEDQLEEFMIESTARAFLQDTTYVVFGKGGFSKEIVWLMNQLNIPNIRQAVYGEDEVDRDECLVIGIGDPILKKQIAEKYKNYSFPNIVAKDCLGEVVMQEGNIICNGNIFTVGIVIGSYNAINLRCTVGHGVSIGSYNQINPGVNISGRVTIGSECLIGTGVQILENVSICDGCIIGAGAVVTKDLTESGTYVGIPARKI